jgi:hypothetical protein
MKKGFYSLYIGVWSLTVIVTPPVIIMVVIGTFAPTALPQCDWVWVENVDDLLLYVLILLVLDSYIVSL